MALVELTPDEIELLTQAYQATLRPNPQDRGFTVTSYGHRVELHSGSIDRAYEDAKRWGAAVRGLVDKGLFESVNAQTDAFRLSRLGVQRAADMNPLPVSL